MISAFFTEDHREIDALFGQLNRQLAAAPDAGDTEDALLAESFREVDGRLERHIQWEEEVLFPAVEEKMPELAQGPGHVMREEHKDIRAHMKKARETLSSPPLDRTARETIQGALRMVEFLLTEHNEKEEAVYYPLSDSLFTAEEATGILDRIKEWQ